MRPSLFPILFFIAAIGLFFGYTNSTYEVIKELQVEAGEFDEALAQSRELGRVRDELLTRFNTFPSRELEQLEKFLPDNVDNVKLVLDIDNIASKYGLRIQNVVVSNARTSQANNVAVVQEALFDSVELEFTVIAGYENFIQFIEDLETSLRLVDVVALSFNVSDDTLYGHGFRIRTYWLK